MAFVFRVAHQQLIKTNDIRHINHTNTITELEPGQSITDALAQRDVLGMEHRVLTAVIEAATARHQVYSRSEVRYVSTVDVAALQQRADDLARRHRELDSRIQAQNWQVDLIE